MLLVATWLAPKFLSIQILPVVGLVITPMGVTEFEAELGALLPLIFVATTVKV
jgi:hypothetical protein